MNTPIRAKILRHIRHARILRRLGSDDTSSIYIIHYHWTEREAVSDKVPIVTLNDFASCGLWYTNDYE